MSLESAAAILQAANDANPLTPMQGVNPDSATLIPKISEEKITGAGVIPEPQGTEIKEPGEKSDPKKLEEKPKDEKRELESKRFALLAKKEKENYRKAQYIRQQEEIINQKSQAVENFENFRSQVKANPMLALQELGVTYDQLTQYVLQGKMPNPESFEIKEVREELQNIREEQQKKEERAKLEAQKMAQVEVQQRISAFQEEIGDYIKSNVDKYEFININKADNLVFKVIDNHFQTSKRLMNLEEASDIVEKYLEEQVRLNNQAKKLQKATQQPKEADQKTSNQSQQRQTINNQMTSSAPSFLPAKTEQERLNRALAALSKN